MVDVKLKVMVCGSRTITDKDWIFSQIEQFWYWNLAWCKNLELVEGGAQGVDLFAKEYAIENEWEVKEFPANWKTYGKKAGILRNQIMIDYCDLCLILWDGQSKGTKHDIDICEQKKKKYFVVRYDLKEDYVTKYHQDKQEKKNG